MDLTRRLRGKRVAQAMTNGHLLSLRMENNDEVNIAWVDENGIPIKGRPVVHSSGGRLNVSGLRDLIRRPFDL